MKIWIIHSHLNPGGVTQVIKSQIKSLKGYETILLSGAPPQNDFKERDDVVIKVSENINYLERKPYSREEAKNRLQSITRTLSQIIQSGSIIHVHNLNLGKNPLVTYAIYLMAQKGYAVFNHAHDFAEDRPANIKFLKEIIEVNLEKDLNEVLYPNLPNYHFGVLNSFDKNRLIGYGIPSERILWIPNPVEFDTSGLADKVRAKEDVCAELSIDPMKLLITYPVRVIKRKNIGELLLLWVLFEHMAEFVVTQPPLNPLEKVQYDQWLEWCSNNNIRVLFEAGNKVDFKKLIVASDFCITTSIREGFGMVYLEPWLAGTSVTGRDIASITADFKNDGIVFPNLYQEIKVPMLDCDFKDLDESKQKEIIAGIKNDAVKRERFIEQNPGLMMLFNKIKQETIQHNASVIEKNYSIEKYGIKLQNRYSEMARQTGTP